MEESVRGAERGTEGDIAVNYTRYITRLIINDCHGNNYQNTTTQLFGWRASCASVTVINVDQ